MKKIYFIVSLTVLALFTACQDYNSNFPGYKPSPTNVVSYNYTLTDADYTTIATAIKKPVNDSITLLKAQLKAARTSADSTKINAGITRLNTKLTTDSTYINASYIASNKFFNSKLQAKNYIPYLFNTVYNTADNGSIIKAVYSTVDLGDTLSIPAVNRVTLAAADYVLMGTAANQPGQYKNFSNVMPVLTYLNGFLKLKFPFALANEVRVVSYINYDSNKVTKKQYRILTFDGQNWNAAPVQYLNNGTQWFFDPTLYVPLVKGSPNNLYVMAFLDYLRTHSTDATNPTKWYPKLTYTNEEHYYGFSAYYPEIIMSADRTTYGDAAIKALTTNDDKYVLFRQRVAEGMPLFAQINFPLLQTNVSGLQQYIVFTIPSYYSSSKSGLFTIKLKCTVSGTASAPATYEVVSCVETGI